MTVAKAGVVLAVLTSGIVGSISAQSRWLLASPPGVFPQVSIDTTTILRPERSYLRAWVEFRHELDKVETFSGRSVSFRASKQRMDFDCSQHFYRIGAMSWFASTGEVVHSFPSTPTEWSEP